MGNEVSSICHGEVSLGNVLRGRDRLYLIDPRGMMTDIDEQRNRLWVGVESKNDIASVRSLATRARVPTEALLVEQEEPIRQLTSLRDQHRPLVGGLQITLQNADPAFLNICTLGFIAVRAGVTGFVTNTHCTRGFGSVGLDAVGQPDLQDAVGTESVDPPLFNRAANSLCPSGRECRWSDAAFIRATPLVQTARGAVARASVGSPAWNGNAYYTIDAKGDVAAQTVVIKVGRTTGYTAGKVIRTCGNVNQAGTNRTMLCQWTTDFRVASGDSGAPALCCADGTFRGLVGIVWGGSSTSGVYSAMHEVQRSDTELGPLTVCYGGASC